MRARPPLDFQNSLSYNLNMDQPLPNYRGWRRYYCPKNPVTGTWVGERFGVEVNAGDELALHRIIDQRIKEYPWEGGDNSSVAYTF